MIDKYAVAALAALAAVGTSALAADKGDVELAYVEWSSEVASTNLVKAVLEDMGYDVKITPVSAAAMWQAVGSGDVDGLVAAWLPTTHNHYLEQVSDKVVDLGPNLVGTRIGLVVPAYVEIDSIEDLEGAAERFDGKIIGIDPGAGLMSKTETVLEDYDITDLTLVEGTGPIMTAVLGDAIEKEEWVVVTGWTPHWMFAQYDLKYLDDPKGIYGGEEEIHTIVREGLKEDLPEVYAVLDNFSWTPDQMAELMVMNQERRADPLKNAKLWIAEHPDVVASWMPDNERE
ncbi:glycine betaine ABC transporter substrate-binding protein [Thiocapsa bogorovii]|uniref:glycine betaine ABC transporter substrate-binding protein n=1 Tax=Thiocapsa bogorovii TaxID=521689 RepID=UPI001E6131B5|nr:glycine betaine ABC transporter substrate-binding protein [Thiocapsa bogorovii]UHD18627.1 glycine betaine ABC transporter substrate-binding protein [Thiocapsa bogorovii]